MSTSFLGDMSKPLFVGGVFLSTFASGLQVGLSVIAVPGILAAYYHPETVSSTKTPLSDPSPLLLSQFARLYHLGARVAIPLVMGAALCNLGNAYIHYAPTTTAVGNALGGSWGTQRSYMFAAAAALTAAVPPFTFLVMMPTNTELLLRDEEGKGNAVQSGIKRKDGSSRELLTHWGMLNLVRASLSAVATILAFEAL